MADQLVDFFVPTQLKLIWADDAKSLNLVWAFFWTGDPQYELYFIFHVLTCLLLRETHSDLQPLRISSKWS